MSKQLIITSALPYANGPLHFGHLLEHIQTDIWVRTNRLLKEKCIYLCASDAHGTPIMMKAESEQTQMQITKANRFRFPVCPSPFAADWDGDCDWDCDCD